MPCYIAGWSLLHKDTADLLCLDFCRPSYDHHCHTLMAVTSPLNLAAWELALSTHPDKAFARYVCRGIREGFRIGFKHSSPLKSAQANMKSASEHPEIISEYLAKECQLGRMLGPFTQATELPQLQVNRFGVIPKGHNTGKFRLITDLSFPPGQSVNDGIDPNICSLAYTTVEEVAACAASFGKGALLAKVDIESAYRLIPVHPQDRVLQGMQWNGMIYVDPMLPFGLRSAPKIFNAVAEALHWHLLQSGISHLYHYLDDYIMVAPPQSACCQQSLGTLLVECGRLGVPIAPHKTVGPTTVITFLGIQIDTINGELRLPADKLQRLRELLASWGGRRGCTRKDLESLIGMLNHACKVIRSGRSFLRRMIDLLHATHRPHACNTAIRLNLGFRADLAWWQEFLAAWNGVSYLYPPRSFPKVHLYSDASGSWGCAAWCGDAWFQVQWDARASSISIAEKELIPIILACEVWGQSWSGCQVICHCDNQSVVADLRSRTSKQKGMMHLLRCVVFVEASTQCSLSPVYIDTKANHLADALSRNDAASFLLKVPSASSCPSLTSPQLLDLLLDQDKDWVHPTWRQQFGSIFNRGWQPQHARPTQLA